MAQSRKVVVGRPVSILAVAAAVLLALAPFQNCSNSVKLRGPAPGPGTRLEATGNGQPYEGKPYVFRDVQCPDLSDVHAVIKIRGPGDAALVRDHCEYLPEPIPLSSTDYSIDSSDVLRYGTRDFAPLEVEIPLSGGLLANGSFESGLNGWSGFGNYFVTSAGFQLSGVGGLKSGPELSGVEYDVTGKVSVGGTYSLSVFAKIDHLTDVAAVGCKSWDASNALIYEVKADVVSSDYTKYTVSCTIPQGAAKTVIFSWRDTGTGKLYLDDFQFQ